MTMHTQYQSIFRNNMHLLPAYSTCRPLVALFMINDKYKSEAVILTTTLCTREKI